MHPAERAASRAERAYDRLREYLRSGKVTWGEPLREVSLASKLGVSRTPVREALSRLAGEGLVEAHGRSFTVPRLSEEDLDHIYDLRLLLETEAIRQAARGSTRDSGPEDVKRSLEEAAAAHERGDAERFIAANRRFRAAWLSLVPNRRLVRMVELYADHVRALQLLTLGDPGRQRIVLRGMRDILRALERGDAAAAAEAMRRYLGISRDAMLRAAGRMLSAKAALRPQRHVARRQPVRHGVQVRRRGAGRRSTPKTQLNCQEGS